MHIHFIIITIFFGWVEGGPVMIIILVYKGSLAVRKPVLIDIAVTSDWLISCWFSVYGNESSLVVFSLDTHLLLKYHHVNELKGFGWIYSGVLPSLLREDLHCPTRSISASFQFCLLLKSACHHQMTCTFRAIEKHWEMSLCSRWCFNSSVAHLDLCGR